MMSTQGMNAQGELKETELMAAIKAALAQHNDRLDDVTTADVLNCLAVSLGMDRTALKRQHKPQIEHALAQAYGRLEPPSRLTDTLYLGSEWNATNLEELRALRIRHVVNCTSEHDVGGVPAPFGPDGITYMRLAQLDDNDATLIQYWDDVHGFIKRAQAEQSSVLVHCQRGVSRSAATCVAFLMKDRDWSKSDALDYVRSCRPIIKPNVKFMRELDEYEAQLFDAKMAAWKPQ
eukprot:m.130734 g.130734  ORF g.130734 m.130734 type:complete len:234 (-) comp11291_c0_seq1:6539-7240(-)